MGRRSYRASLLKLWEVVRRRPEADIQALDIEGRVWLLPQYIGTVPRVLEDPGFRSSRSVGDGQEPIAQNSRHVVLVLAYGGPCFR